MPSGKHDSLSGSIQCLRKRQFGEQKCRSKTITMTRGQKIKDYLKGAKMVDAHFKHLVKTCGFRQMDYLVLGLHDVKHWKTNCLAMLTATSTLCAGQSMDCPRSKLCALSRQIHVLQPIHRFFVQSGDPGFAQANPQIVWIHALHIT